MKDTNLARVVARLIVVDHAIARYLDRIEGATQDTIQHVLFSLRQEATDFMADELAGAVLMNPLARRIFIDPERESRIGTRRIFEDDSEIGERYGSKRAKRRDSQYYWTGYAIFVVEHNMLMTVVKPDENQLTTMHEVMPEAADLQKVAPSLLHHCRRCAVGNLKRDSGVHRLTHKTDFQREAPPLPRWKGKNGASWDIFIIPDNADREELRAIAQEVRTLGEGTEVFAEMSDGFTRQFVGRLDNRKVMDDASSEDDEAPLSSRTVKQTLRIRSLPSAPKVNWRKVDEAIPTSARRWWNEMLRYGESAGKIVTVVTPTTAKEILEIAQGHSWAQWRKTFREGRVSKVRISFSGQKVVLSYT